MASNNPLHGVRSEFSSFVECQQQPLDSNNEETNKRQKSNVLERISIVDLSKAGGSDSSCDTQTTVTPIKRLTALSVSKRWQKVSHSLHKRKVLFQKHKRISDFALAFGMFGIITMIIENELASAGVFNESSLCSFFLKMSISVSTVILLGLIVIYRVFEVQIFLIQNSVDDWRIAMTWQRIIQIGSELLICAVHPFPGEPYFSWTKDDISNNPFGSRWIPIDVALSLPMFFRFYLIFRSMHLHKLFKFRQFISKLFTDTTSRSIGAFNNIVFDTRFIFKTLMTIYPGIVLFVLVGSLWIIASWIMRQCERSHDEEYSNLLNTMWLIMITFLTIGYGDMYPKTYCGRSIAVATGFMGAGCTALLVAVILKKMELTQAEKHVHDLMRDTQFTKEIKNEAANVLRESWFIYKYKKLVKRVNTSQIRNHQRKLLLAIYSMRNAKMKQRNLTDNLHAYTSSTSTNRDESHNAANKIISEINARQNVMEQRLSSLEDKLVHLQETLDALPESISRHLTIAKPKYRSSIGSTLLI